MTRKILLLAFLIIITGGVFAQADEDAFIDTLSERAGANTFTFSAGLFSVDLSYERAFNQHFSLLLNTSYYWVLGSWTASAIGRWYPAGRIFFMDLGLGTAYGIGLGRGIAEGVLTILTSGWWADQEEAFNRTFGVIIQPAIGWRLDIGEPGGFTLPIRTGVDLKLGRQGGDFTPFLRVGLGFSF